MSACREECTTPAILRGDDKKNHPLRIRGPEKVIRLVLPILVPASVASVARRSCTAATLTGVVHRRSSPGCRSIASSAATVATAAAAAARPAASIFTRSGFVDGERSPIDLLAVQA